MLIARPDISEAPKTTVKACSVRFEKTAPQGEMTKMNNPFTDKSLIGKVLRRRPLVLAGSLVAAPLLLVTVRIGLRSEERGARPDTAGHGAGWVTPANHSHEPATSLIHGSIAGTVSKYSSANPGLPEALGKPGDSPLERSYQDLVETVRKRQKQSVLRRLWSYVTKRNLTLASRGDEPLLSSDLEDTFFKDLESLLARERLKALAQKAGAATNQTAAWAAFEASLRVSLAERASSADLDSGLVPISVRHGVFDPTPDPDAGAIVVTAPSAGGSLAGITFTSMPTAPAWSGPTLLPLGGNGWTVNANAFGINLPVVSNPPDWASYAPHPRSTNTRGATVTSHLHGSAPIPVVTLPASPGLVPSPVLPTIHSVPTLASATVASESVVSGSGVSTRASFSSVAAPVTSSPGVSSQSSSFSQPAQAPSVIYVGNGNGPGGTGFVSEYSAVTSGTPVTTFAPAPANGATILGLAIGYPGGTEALYIADESNADVRAVNATTGAALPGFTTITGFTPQSPDGLVISGNTLYVANGNAATIQAYNATTGSRITYNPTSASLNFPYCLAVSGNVLYVGDVGSAKILTFDATSGAALSLPVPSVQTPTDIAIDGNVLYVADDATEKVTAYNLSGGALAGFTTINIGAFDSGHGDVSGIAVLNGDLFVEDDDGNTVTEWNALTGAQIAYTSPSGLNSPLFIVAVPEPASTGLLLVSVGMLLSRRRRSGGRRAS
jgi:hypothetical protein